MSFVGDIFTIALALEALRVDRSPDGLAFVFAARAVPSVCFALVGGVVVDRVPRRLAMLFSDLVRGLAVGAIALLDGASVLKLWELVVMSALFGAADAFFGPASMATFPELLPAELWCKATCSARRVTSSLRAWSGRPVAESSWPRSEWRGRSASTR